MVSPVWGQTDPAAGAAPQTQVIFDNSGAANRSSVFGYSVAVSGNGQVMVVGAGSSAAVLGGAGSAYVYIREDSGSWSTVPATVLRPSNTNRIIQFGGAVAVDGSGDTIVVGAPLYDAPFPGALDVGRVYIFTREDDDMWIESTILNTAHPKPTNNFYRLGVRVAITADGQTIAASAAGGNYAVVDGAEFGITAPEELNDMPKNNQGLVEIFNRDGNTWVHEVFIGATNPGQFDYFGGDFNNGNVSISVTAGGLDMVGNRDTAVLAVGSGEEDGHERGVHRNYRANSNSQFDSGAVYVYRRNDGKWDTDNIFYIKADNVGFRDIFGYTVALSADGMMLAVGAYREDSRATGAHNPSINNNSARDSGAVYLYRYDGAEDTWEQTNYIKASYQRRELYFSVVALSADGSLLAVGAIGDSSTPTGVHLGTTYNPENVDSHTNSGAVFVFARSGDSWTQAAVIKRQSYEGNNPYFGYRVGFGGTAGAAESLVMGAAEGLVEVIATQDLFLSPLTVEIGGNPMTNEAIVLAGGEMVTVEVSGGDVTADVTVTIGVSVGITASVGTIVLTAGAPTAEFTLTATESGVAELMLTAPQYRPVVIDFMVLENPQITAPAAVILEEDTNTTIEVRVNSPPDMPLTITALAEDPDSAISLGNTELMLSAGETSTMLTITAIDNDEFNPMPRVATVTLTAEGYTTATVVVTVEEDSSVTLSLDVADEILLVVGGTAELTMNLQAEGDIGGLALPTLTFVVDPAGIIEVASSQAGVLNGSTPVEVTGVGVGNATLTLTVSGDNYVTTVTEVQVTVEALILEVAPALVSLTEGEGDATVSVRLNRRLNEMEIESGAMIRVTVVGDAGGLMVGMVGGGMLSGVNGDEVRIGDDGTVESVVTVADDEVYTGDRQVMVRMGAIGVDGIVGELEAELTVNIEEDEDELSLEVLDEEGNVGIETLTVSEGGSGVFTVRVNRIDTIGGSLSLTITGGEDVDGLTISPRMIELTREPTVLSATITVDVAENDIIDVPVTLAIAASGYAEQTLRVRIADNDSSVSFDREGVEIGREVGSTATAEVVLSTMLTEAVTVQIANPTSRLSVAGMRDNLVELDIGVGSTVLSLEIAVAEALDNEEAEDVILTIERAETASGDAVVIGDESLVVTIAAGIIQFMLKVFLEGAQ